MERFERTQWVGERVVWDRSTGGCMRGCPRWWFGAVCGPCTEDQEEEAVRGAQSARSRQYEMWRVCRFHTYDTTTSTSPREEMVAGREETRDAARAVSVWPSAKAAGGGASSQASHCWSVVLPVVLTLAVARVRAWVSAVAAREARHSRRIVLDTIGHELLGEERNLILNRSSLAEPFQPQTGPRLALLKHNKNDTHSK